MGENRGQKKNQEKEKTQKKMEGGIQKYKAKQT